MILAIGYRVRTRIGIHFRNWATSLIHEYTQKGFVLNDERLKEPKAFGDDYFDELRELYTIEFDKNNHFYLVNVNHDELYFIK